MLTSGPVNANFFVFQPVELPNEQVVNDVVAALSDFSIDGGYNLKVPTLPLFPDCLLYTSEAADE